MSHKDLSGKSADASKRNEYIRWAQTKNAWLIEDDYASEFAGNLKTEKTLFSNMIIRSAAANASAPPLPPSPVRKATVGTRSRLIVMMQRAIASPWPRSSASLPG